MRIASTRKISIWLGGSLLAATAWAQTDGALRWPAPFTTLSTSTAGSILSSAAAGPDGTIYFGVEVGSSTSSAPSGRVFALNPSGAQKWAFTPPSSPDWIDATPTVGTDGTIYVGCWNGMLYALRPADGSLRWQLKVGTFVASSPALGADGTIYVGAGSNLVAVTPEGALKWTFPAADWIDASPAVGPDGTIYVGSWDNNFYAVRPDGTEKWRFAAADNIASSAALAADGTIYFGSRDVRLYALAPDGTLKWSFDTADTIEASPALGADGAIYVTTTGGRLFALNRDGTERWRYPAAGQPALNAIYSSPAVRADGSIVFGSSNSAVYAVRADGSLLWRTAIGDSTDASPLVAGDGALYLGAADKKLYALNSVAGATATDWPQFRRDPRRNAWQPLGNIAGTTGRLTNLSVRTFAGAGADTLVVGFVVSGSGARSLLLRGVGPTLGAFGVSGVLANPGLAAFSGQTLLAANDDWGTAGNASTVASTSGSVGAFALPANSLDAALLNTFGTGGYTAQVTGAGGSTGVALMEAYDAGGASGARLINVSARSAVGTGAGILIAGFTVGENTRAVLVRGIGPALTGFGVGGALGNPQLKIFRGDQLIAENDNWHVASNAADVVASGASVGAFPLAPGGSQDAALLLTLPPGSYTAQVSGVGGTTGIGLIEVYELR